MKQEKHGVLLVNTGTPDAPTSSAVKRYLKEFLSDDRVVDTAPLIWWPILNGAILPIRSPRVAKLYQSVWMEEGSPLLVYSRRQQRALAARMPNTPVELGMSYGSPSLAEAVDKLLAQGVTNGGAAALSAIFLFHQRGGMGWRGASAERLSPFAFCGLHPRLRRTPGLHRRAAAKRGALVRRTRPAGSAGAVVPRHPQTLCAPGRRLPAALRGYATCAERHAAAGAGQ